MFKVLSMVNTAKYSSTTVRYVLSKHTSFQIQNMIYYASLQYIASA